MSQVEKERDGVMGKHNAKVVFFNQSCTRMLEVYSPEAHTKPSSMNVAGVQTFATLNY